MNIIKTKRLILRRVNKDDYIEMKSILQNEDLMLNGWGKTYSDDEVQIWINKILKQYEEYGYSYYICIEKTTNRVIGLMGMLSVNIKDIDYVEIAYILKQKYWGYGYATESIGACISYGFNILKFDKLIAQVIPNNINSIKVIERLGMKLVDKYNRDYKNQKAVHLIYELTKEEYIRHIQLA